MSSQGGGLTSGARADIALMTVEQTVPDPHVCSCAGVAQLTLTDPTLKALDVEVKAESLYNHGGSFTKRMTTTGTQFLPTDRPVW